MPIPYIDEILADHETRLLWLEGNNQVWTREDIKEIVKEVLEETLQKPELWTTKQWAIINQLRGEVQHIHKEHHAIQHERKSKSRDKI